MHTVVWHQIPSPDWTSLISLSRPKAPLPLVLESLILVHIKRLAIQNAWTVMFRSRDERVQNLLITYFWNSTTHNYSRANAASNTVPTDKWSQRSRGILTVEIADGRKLAQLCWGRKDCVIDGLTRPPNAWSVRLGFADHASVSPRLTGQR